MPQTHAVDPGTWEGPPPATITAPHVDIAVPAQPDTNFVSTQHLAPYLIGLLRGVYLGVFGAVGGMLSVLTAGVHDERLLWGALAGFCAGFLGRTAEAVVIDTPKMNSTTEKV